MFDNSSIDFPNIRKISQKSSQILIFLIFLFLLHLQENLFSQTSSVKVNDSQAVENKDTIQTKSNVKRMKKDDFLYADSYRYTLTGKLPPLENNLKTSTYLYTGLGVGALFYGQHYFQSKTIWAEKSEFRVIEDGAYGLYVDKTGHFVSSYLSCYMLGEAMLAVDMMEKQARLIGGLLGMGYITYIEIMDGFGANFGFSPSDFYFNAAGAGFYILQNYVPYLENFTPKFQIINSELFGYEKRVESTFFVDDYASQVFFISMNVHNMLPDNLKNYWLPWLELSFGYTARNLTNINEKHDHVDLNKNPDWGNLNGEPFYLGEPRFIIALDYNLTKLIPESDYTLVNWAVQSLNYFKFPAPAIEFDINGKARFLLMYPFISF